VETEKVAALAWAGEDFTGLNPFIVGLLQTLPPPQTEWSSGPRQMAPDGGEYFRPDQQG